VELTAYEGEMTTGELTSFTLYEAYRILEPHVTN